MSTRSVYYRRRFLNRPRHHAGAYVIARVEVHRSKSETPHVDARLQLSDCSRLIELDFDAYDRGDARNALRKVVLLRRVFVEYEEALRSALGDANLTPGE